MAIITVISQIVQGDPANDGTPVNIIMGAFATLEFDSDILSVSQSGAVSVDGADPVGYTYLGSGNVRGDPDQLAAFIRLDDGSTFAIDLDADGDGTADLQNGNTQLQIAELDQSDVDLDPDPVCFTPGALVETPDGPRAVETLAPGDPVLTRDHGPQPLLFVGRSAHRFATRPHKDQPILFAAGCLGPGVPARDFIVSPQHRLLLAGPEIARRFDAPEVLALAKGLTGLPGVRAMKGRRRVEYVSLLLERHEILTVDGVLTESFYPGPTALKMIGPALRAGVVAAVPRLADDPAGYGPTAAPVLTRREAESLAPAFAAGDMAVGRAPALA